MNKKQKREIRELQNKVEQPEYEGPLSKKMAQSYIWALLCGWSSKELQKYSYDTIAYAINKWVERIKE